MYAAGDNPNPEVLSVLLREGAKTPLMHAAEGNPTPEIISLLLLPGASVRVWEVRDYARS